MPKEPAIWANLGLARLRLGDLPGAGQALDTAAKLAPTNDDVALLQAIVDENQGQFPEAVERLRGLPNPDVAVLLETGCEIHSQSPEGGRGGQARC
jgi:hypothetical protein